MQNILLFPWLAVTFVKDDAGMAICFILFFVVNPIYSVIIGIFSGKNISGLWCLPIISSVLFLVGAWIFFDPGEMAFVMYAVIYFVLGISAMLLSIFINKKLKID